MFQRSFSSSAALNHAASGAGTDDKGKSVDKTRVTRALFSSPTKENTQAGISERHKRLKVRSSDWSLVMRIYFSLNPQLWKIHPQKVRRIQKANASSLYRNVVEPELDQGPKTEFRSLPNRPNAKRSLLVQTQMSQSSTLPTNQLSSKEHFLVVCCLVTLNENLFFSRCFNEQYYEPIDSRPFLAA